MNVNSSKLIVDVYMSPYLILLILEFFPAWLAMFPLWAWFKCYQTTYQPVNQAICILLFCQWYLLIFQIKIIIVIPFLLPFLLSPLPTDMPNAAFSIGALLHIS